MKKLTTFTYSSLALDFSCRAVAMDRGIAAFSGIPPVAGTGACGAQDRNTEFEPEVDCSRPDGRTVPWNLDCQASGTPGVYRLIACASDATTRGWCAIDLGIQGPNFPGDRPRGDTTANPVARFTRPEQMRAEDLT